MTQINQLSSIDTLEDGDLFPFYDSSNGDARKIAWSKMKYAPPASDKITQYATPLTGETIPLPADTKNTWLVVTPAGAIAALTIALPNGTLAIHDQEILVFCSQIVTTLTLTSVNATVFGAPASLAANGFFTLRFEGVLKRWYRVG